MYILHAYNMCCLNIWDFFIALPIIGKNLKKNINDNRKPLTLAHLSCQVVLFMVQKHVPKFFTYCIKIHRKDFFFRYYH